MLQNSNNLYASALTKHLGYAVTHEGTNKQGVFAMCKILSEFTTLNCSEFNLADGVGTRYNLISAAQFVNLLHGVYQDKSLYQPFLNTLPVAGISGTLKHSMKNTVLEGRVYAKTGKMSDMVSLTGFLTQDNQPPIIFSIIINGIHGSLETAKSLEIKLLTSLVE